METLQGTAEWHKQRLGKFTASEIHRLLTDPKLKADKDAGNLSDGAETYVLEKVAEILTGQRPEFSSRETEWGNEYEPMARQQFEFEKNLKVSDCGFIPHKKLKDAGGSPDGLIGEGAILEIKCPFNSTNHIQHMMIQDNEYFKKYFKEYYYQCQANMLFSGRNKCYFASFDPRIFGEQSLFVFELFRDVDATELIESKLKKAITYKNEVLRKLNHVIELAA